MQCHAFCRRIANRDHYDEQEEYEGFLEETPQWHDTHHLCDLEEKDHPEQDWRNQSSGSEVVK